jgi:hypothetical protein
MARQLVDGSIFLHVPKTGGSWVTRVLESQGLIKRKIGGKHDDLDRVLRLTQSRLPLPRPLRRREPETPFTFCFVRHPLAWYESWFTYMSAPKQAWRDWGARTSGFTRDQHPVAVLNGCGADDFNRFVEKAIARRPGYVGELYGWYARPETAFVGKQETLAEDLLAVLKQRGIAVDEAAVRGAVRENVSAGAQGPQWDPDLKAEVRRLEYAAIKRFGYE